MEKNKGDLFKDCLGAIIHGSDEPEFIYFFQLKKSYFMFVTVVVI